MIENDHESLRQSNEQFNRDGFIQLWVLYIFNPTGHNM